MSSSRSKLAHVLVAALASVAVPRHDQATLPGARVSGRVVETSGRPLAGATVILEDSSRSRRTTLTSASGQFEFAKIPAGRYSFRASAPGYPETSFGSLRSQSFGSLLVVSGNDPIEALEIVVPRGSTLTGVVFNRFMTPYAGVGVSAFSVRIGLDGKQKLSMAGSAISDESGRYRIFGLSSGRYVVGTSPMFAATLVSSQVVTSEDLRIIKSPRQGSTSEPRPVGLTDEEFGYLPTFHPNAYEASDATAISLDAGEVRDGVDLSMQFGRLGKIRGSITSMNGTAPPVRLSLLRRSLGVLGATTHWNTSDGRFSTMALPPGEYTVVAVTNEATEARQWAYTDISLGPGVTSDVALRLGPMATVAGQVTVRNGEAKPVAGLRLMLEPLSLTGLAAVSVTVGQDGSFRMENIMPGTYTLRVSTAAGSVRSRWHLEQVSIGGEDVTDLMFRVQSYGVTSLNVRLTDESAGLRGFLLDKGNRPQAGLWVAAFPIDDRYWIDSTRRIAVVQSDSTGQFLVDLPVGSYAVAVATNLRSEDLTSATALKEVLKNAITCRVVERDSPCSVRVETGRFAAPFSGR